MNRGEVRWIAGDDRAKGRPGVVVTRHAVVGHDPTDLRVSQTLHLAVDVGKDAEVVLDPLLDLIVVVPDDRVRRIDIAQSRDVSRFDRREEAVDKLLGGSHKEASLPPGLGEVRCGWDSV